MITVCILNFFTRLIIELSDETYDLDYNIGSVFTPFLIALCGLAMVIVSVLATYVVNLVTFVCCVVPLKILCLIVPEEIGRLFVSAVETLLFPITPINFLTSSYIQEMSTGTPFTSITVGYWHTGTSWFLLLVGAFFTALMLCVSYAQSLYDN